MGIRNLADFQGFLIYYDCCRLLRWQSVSLSLFSLCIDGNLKQHALITMSKNCRRSEVVADSATVTSALEVIWHTVGYQAVTRHLSVIFQQKLIKNIRNVCRISPVVHRPLTNVLRACTFGNHAFSYISTTLTKVFNTPLVIWSASKDSKHNKTSSVWQIRSQRMLLNKL